MAYIKNGVVDMLWDSEGFYETKKEGFVAAVQIYSCTDGVDRAVMFKDNKAFFLYDEDEEDAASRDEIKNAILEAVKDEGAGVNIADYYSDAYVPISEGGLPVEQGIKDFYHLSDEICEDIIKRIEDLSPYYEVTYQSMV